MNVLVLMQGPEEAANDMAEWMEEVFGQDLSDEEEEQLLVKMSFWWAVAVAQRDAVSCIHSRN